MKIIYGIVMFIAYAAEIALLAFVARIVPIWVYIGVLVIVVTVTACIFSINDDY